MSRLFCFLVTIALFFPSFLHPQSNVEAIERAQKLNQEHSPKLAAIDLAYNFQGTLKVDADESLKKFLVYWIVESLGLEQELPQGLAPETGLDEAKYPKFVAFRDEVVLSFVAVPEITPLNSYRLYSPERRAQYILEKKGLSPVRGLDLEDIDFDGFLLTYPYQHEDATSPIRLKVGEDVTLKINRTDLEQFEAGNITKQEVLRKAHIFVNGDRVEIQF